MVHLERGDCLPGVPGTVADADAIERFVAEVAKVELHVHLVGSAALATVRTLAERSPQHGVPSDLDELRASYTFRDFTHFLEVYAAVNALVQTSADVVTLLDGLTDLLVQRVRYAEVTITPWAHVAVGLPYPEPVEGLDEGRRRAAARGVELASCFDIAAHLEPHNGAETARWAVEEPPDGLVGLGSGAPRPAPTAATLSTPSTAPGPPGCTASPTRARAREGRVGVGGAADPEGRAHRPRHPQHRHPGAGRPPRRAPDSARCLPDLERPHPGTMIDGSRASSRNVQT
jgi:hypothetical protein